MKKKIWTELAILVALIPCAVAVAYADSDGGCPRRGPPEEAFTACASAKEGDACTVTFGDRAIAGTCEPFGDRGLACRPDGPPPPR
jgi:hypothetical protein